MVAAHFLGALLFGGLDGIPNKIIHFFMPLFGAPLLYLFFVNAELRKVIGDPRGIIFAVTLLGTAAAVVWEIIEFAAAPFSAIILQPSNQDTMLDLIASVGGSVVGGVMFVLHRTRPR